MKYIVPIVAVVALVLGVLNAIPTKMLGGQYSTNHAYFNGVTNSGTLTQTGAVGITGALTNTGAVEVVGDINADESNTTTTLSLGNTGVGKLCLYNGTQYSILSFAAGSTSTAISTSTSCL